MNADVLFRSILLVEDDPSHTLLIKRSLAGLGGEVSNAENLQDAYALLEGKPVDLIVTDLHLPDSEGVTHVAKLSELSQATPIIVLTSSTNLTDAVEAMKLGAKDFIVKDFDKNFREVLSLSLNRVAASRLAERERRKLQAAIENSDDGLAVVTPSGAIRYSNSAFERFIKRCGGVPDDFFSLLTEKVEKFELLTTRLRDGLRTLDRGEVRHFEVSLVGDEGKSYDLSLSGIDEDDSASETLPEVVVWLRDISEQKRREKFQRQMLSTTTHDLKGPLGAVLTGSELLSEMVEKEKAKQLVLRISSATQGVIHLIDEFLSARRIEEGNFILKPKRHEATDLLAGVRANFETIAQSRSIELSFDIPENLELHVDKLGFERVLGNLLSNALKFSGKQGTVTVRLEDQGADTVIVVSDTGSGMEPSEVKMIFERFSRLEKHQETNGTGIGLFVVKSIVDAHGGQIEVASKLGKGTTFKIYFPKEPPVNARGELFCLD